LPLCIDYCYHEVTTWGNFIHGAIAVQIQSLRAAVGEHTWPWGSQIWRAKVWRAQAGALLCFSRVVQIQRTTVIAGVDASGIASHQAASP
jgi:hypothetical protein